MTKLEDVSNDSKLSDVAVSQTRLVFYSVLVKASESDPTYPLFIGKYNYSSRTDNDLGFKKGELLYIL